MEFKKQLVTPEIAKQLLDKNLKNRNLKTVYVERYAEDMKSGRWKEDTAEPIKINKHGHILDGQNRLHAVIKSGQPIYFHIVSGLDDSILPFLDSGAARTPGDQFKIHGIKNDVRVSASISLYFRLKNQNAGAINSDKRTGATNKVLLDMYDERPKFWQNIVAKIAYWYPRISGLLTPAQIGGFYAFFHDINALDAEDFMEQLCTGMNVKNKTIALLRTKLMDDKLGTRKMTAATKYSYLVKTWNMFRNGREVKSLSFDPSKEEFPTAI